MKKRNKLIAVFAPLVLGATVLVSQKVQAVNYQIILNDNCGKYSLLDQLDIEEDNDFECLTADQYLLHHYGLPAEELDHVERDMFDKKIIINLKKRHIRHQATGISLTGCLSARTSFCFSGFLLREENKAKFEQCFPVHLDRQDGFIKELYSNPENTFQYGDDSKIAIKYGADHELDYSKFSPKQRQAIDKLRHGQAVDLANCPLDHAEFDKLQKFSELGLAPLPLKMTYLFYRCRDGKTYYRPIFSMEKLAGTFKLFDYFNPFSQIPLADQKEVVQNLLNTLIRLHDQGIAYGGEICRNVLVDPRTHQVYFVGFGCSRQDPDRAFDPDHNPNLAFDRRCYQEVLWRDKSQFLSSCLNVLRRNFDLRNLTHNYSNYYDESSGIDPLKFFKAEAIDLIKGLRPILTEADFKGLSLRQRIAKEEIYQVARNELRFAGEIKFDPTQKCPISGKEYVDCNKLALVCLKTRIGNHRFQYSCQVYDYDSAKAYFSRRRTAPLARSYFDRSDPNCFFESIYLM